jgi:hypothetical protein
LLEERLPVEIRAIIYVPLGSPGSNSKNKVPSEIIIVETSFL